jgi:hypothetical protein
MTTKTGFGFHPPAGGRGAIIRDLHAAMDGEASRTLGDVVRPIADHAAALALLRRWRAEMATVFVGLGFAHARLWSDTDALLVEIDSREADQ